MCDENSKTTTKNVSTRCISWHFVYVFVDFPGFIIFNIRILKKNRPNATRRVPLRRFRWWSRNFRSSLWRFLNWFSTSEILSGNPSVYKEQLSTNRLDLKCWNPTRRDYEVHDGCSVYIQKYPCKAQPRHPWTLHQDISGSPSVQLVNIANLDGYESYNEKQCLEFGPTSLEQLCSTAMGI